MSDDSIWLPVSEELPTETDLVTLTALLRELIDRKVNTASAIAYNDQDRTETSLLFTVALSPTAKVVFGTVYEHPGRVVNVVMKPREAAPTPAAPKEASEFDKMVAEYNDKKAK